MVTVNSAGHSHSRQSAADELQHSHLSCGILHSHTVRPQSETISAYITSNLYKAIQITKLIY